MSGICRKMPIHTKGDLMKAVYTPDELRNIDAALPIEVWDEVDNYLTVMNYNNSGWAGTLENMLEIAYQRNIPIASQLFRDHPPVKIKKRFIVTDCAFNQQWYKSIIGKSYDTPPSYARVRDTKLKLS